jgi:hypothetical protein
MPESPRSEKSQHEILGKVREFADVSVINGERVGVSGGKQPFKKRANEA